MGPWSPRSSSRWAKGIASGHPYEGRLAQLVGGIIRRRRRRRSLPEIPGSMPELHLSLFIRGLIPGRGGGL